MWREQGIDAGLFRWAWDGGCWLLLPAGCRVEFTCGGNRVSTQGCSGGPGVASAACCLLAAAGGVYMWREQGIDAGLFRWACLLGAECWVLASASVGQSGCARLWLCSLLSSSNARTGLCCCRSLSRFSLRHALLPSTHPRPHTPSPQLHPHPFTLTPTCPNLPPPPHPAVAS